MTATSLLIDTARPRPIAYCDGRAMDITSLRRAAAALCARMPRTRYVVNLCTRRYGFLIGFVAAAHNQQITLLPPDQAPATLAALRMAYPDQQLVDDAVVAALLANTEISSRHEDAESDPTWRAGANPIAANQVVAIVFTSGSTGTPQPHPKTWHTLASNARLAADAVLGGNDVNIVATVPAQHVYGLETALVSVLATQCAACDVRPFFPGDIRQALESIPAPRTLVTTPAHLRALVESKAILPTLTRIVSATAPLPVDVAARAEAAWQVPVVEIYGCTEAGIMAWRRTVLEQPWRTFTGGTMQAIADQTRYNAAQLPSPVTLQDHIELLSPTEFHLRGRATDMIKVAGKRSSLPALTEALLAIDGVLDAVVFVPQPEGRPAALVVAPTLSAASIATQLTERVDAVFVPRPLVIVTALPRNALGKLPQAALLQMLAAAR